MTLTYEVPMEKGQIIAQKVHNFCTGYINSSKITTTNKYRTMSKAIAKPSSTGCQKNRIDLLTFDSVALSSDPVFFITHSL